MSIVGGLVGTEVERPADALGAPLGEWAMRNAWGVILLGSLAFWLALAGVLAFG